MWAFVIRRILTGLGVLLLASFIMYGMTDWVIDPLEELLTSTDPDKELRIAERIALLNLDQSWVSRYWEWLVAFAQGDFGVAWRTNRSVNNMTQSAIISTVQLVSAATVLSIFLGIIVGVASALRQYTSFDYLITFFSFLMYSLPSFWVAVLLKQWMAIGFNNFLASPSFSIAVIITIGILSAIVWTMAVGGSVKRRLTHGALALAAVAGVLLYLQAPIYNGQNWWSQPNVGLPLLIVTSLVIAFTVTVLSTGLGSRRSLGTALTVVAVGAAIYYPLQTVFKALTPHMNYTLALGGGLLAMIVGALIGVAWWGPDWKQSARTGALTALGVAFLIFTDKVLSYWGAYYQAPAISGRPVPTLGDISPNLGGNFWVVALDQAMHLILPTVALMLISFAGYTRYSRGSMLEVMNQDYIRTARAKGLNERTVVMRHGFRNSMIPLATIVPLDVITLVGGAIITEEIFARPGMGQMFIRGLREAEINPIMSYLVIVAFLAIVANIVADLIYAGLDPRIRVNA